MDEYFKILRDHLAEQDSEDFTQSRAGWTFRYGFHEVYGDCVTRMKEADLPADVEFTQKFRLFDDDGELYYEGVATARVDFAPLDWAENDAGCTEIQYKNPKTGAWETL